MINEMVASLVRSTEKKLQRGSAPPYDPTTWITGTPYRGDNFDNVALNASINGRTLPLGSASAGTWAADAAIVGDGEGAIGFTASHKTAKGPGTHTNCKVRMIWHPGMTGDNQLNVFCRDSVNPSTQRFGYAISTYPALSVEPFGQAVKLYRNADFNYVGISEFIPVTIIRGWNVLEIRCVGSTITGYLNGQKVVEATDTTYTNGTRWGVCQTNITNLTAKITYADMVVL